MLYIGCTGVVDVARYDVVSGKSFHCRCCWCHYIFFTEKEEEEPPAPVLSGAQHEHMLILMRVLYGNPRVLYAPNNTQVDVIMKKVRIRKVFKIPNTKLESPMVQRVSNNQKEVMLQKVRICAPSQLG